MHEIWAIKITLFYPCQLLFTCSLPAKISEYLIVQMSVIPSQFLLQCEAPYRGHPTNGFLQVSQSGYLPPCS